MQESQRQAIMHTNFQEAHAHGLNYPLWGAQGGLCFDDRLGVEAMLTEVARKLTVETELSLEVGLAQFPWLRIQVA